MLLTGSKLRRDGQGGSSNHVALVAIDEAEVLHLAGSLSTLSALFVGDCAYQPSKCRKRKSAIGAVQSAASSASKRIYAKPMRRINYQGEFDSKLKGPILSPGNVYLLGTSSSSRGSTGCGLWGHWG
jgi:hypothetical protein